MINIKVNGACGNCCNSVNIAISVSNEQSRYVQQKVEAAEIYVVDMLEIQNSAIVGHIESRRDERACNRVETSK